MFKDFLDVRSQGSRERSKQLQSFKWKNVFRKIIPPQLKGAVVDLLTYDVFGAVVKKASQ